MDRAARVLPETERMVLRRFTEAGVDVLSDLESDPEVVRFLNGGKPTPRGVIRNETPPRFLDHYGRFVRFGCRAAIEKSRGVFLGRFEFRPRGAAAQPRSSSAMVSRDPPGARAKPPKDRAR